MWLYDLTRRAWTPLTIEGAAVLPTWTRDGTRVAFSFVGPGGVRNLFWRPADASGPPERLAASPREQSPSSFSFDGRELLYVERDPVSQEDIWVLSLDGSRQSRPLLNSRFREQHPELSPGWRLARICLG